MKQVKCHYLYPVALICAGCDAQGSHGATSVALARPRVPRLVEAGCSRHGARTRRDAIVGRWNSLQFEAIPLFVFDIEKYNVALITLQLHTDVLM